MKIDAGGEISFQIIGSGADSDVTLSFRDSDDRRILERANALLEGRERGSLIFDVRSAEDVRIERAYETP